MLAGIFIALNQKNSNIFLTDGFPKGHMRIFGYPSEKPYYVFMIEESK